MDEPEAMTRLATALAADEFAQNLHAGLVSALQETFPAMRAALLAAMEDKPFDTPGDQVRERALAALHDLQVALVVDPLPEGVRQTAHDYAEVAQNWGTLLGDEECQRAAVACETVGQYHASMLQTLENAKALNRELKRLRDCRPAALEFSEAYLKTLLECPRGQAETEA